MPDAAPKVEQAAAVPPAADAEQPAEQAVQGPSVGERLGCLFGELKINKIVVVDDQLERPLDAALVTRIVLEAPDAAQLTSHYFGDLDYSEANENLFDQISAGLGQLDANARSELSSALSEFDREAADVGVPQAIRELAPAEFDIEFLTPQQWVDRREELLAGCSRTARTLFFFDQELDAEGQYGFTKGTELIAELEAEDAEAFGTKWFCGILSHTLEKGAEVATWRAMAQQEQLKLELFMPISKQNLNDGDAFYGAVYRTLINTFTETMKQIAMEAFGTALEQALGTFLNLDPLDFEHAIVKSSEDEGVSALDSLLRLYSIIQKDRVKSQLLQEETRNRFLGAAKTVKRIVDVGRALPEDSSKRLRALRCVELYEAGELINCFHDPLKNGDLFEIGSAGSVKLWVLIAQPCDLMVRKDGERAYESNFKVAVLAPIKTGEPGKPPKDKPGYGFMLDYLDRRNHQPGFVSFANATPVNLNVLDLSVLSAEGKCEIDALSTAELPKFASGSWDARAKHLRKTFKKIAKIIEDVRENKGEEHGEENGDERAAELALHLTPQAAPAAQFRNVESYAKGTFIYKVRRCGRVRDPLASSLLGAFSRYLSRDAHEHDFSAVRSAN